MWCCLRELTHSVSTMSNVIKMKIVYGRQMTVGQSANNIAVVYYVDTHYTFRDGTSRPKKRLCKYADSVAPDQPAYP